MGVVELTVIGNIFRRSSKAKLAIAGVDADPVDGDIRQIRRNYRADIVGSESRVKKIVIAEAMVDAPIECSTELGSVWVEEEVIGLLSGCSNVGQRIQLK